jgi:type IV secretory pathway VirD2 relaxase
VFRFQGNGFVAARHHLYYLEREGTNREGGRGLLYSADEDHADGGAFIERCIGDRHHFRLLLCAEGGMQYEDLTPLIRRFMARAAEDLETRLEWVAANHADTLLPHTHIMLRGKDELGRNLVIAPSYIYYGLAERLRGIVSMDLGPRTEFEDHPELSDVDAERMTSIDRRLIRTLDDNRIVRPTAPDMVEHALRAGRLRKLGSLALAREVGRGRWQLHPEFEEILGRVAERHETARAMQQCLSAAEIERAPAERLIYVPSPDTRLTGRVLMHGRASEKGNCCLILDGVDGRAHYVDLGKDTVTEPLPQGGIVRIEPRVDRDRGTRELAPQVTLLSAVPLEQLAGQEGATWLDEELSFPAARARDQGFGREVRIALAQRRSFLIERGLASLEDGEFHCRADMLDKLRARAIQQAALVIGQETGLSFNSAPPGSRLEGKLRQRLDLPSGQFGMVEGGFEFSLVPWHPELAPAVGQHVCVSVHDREISWTIGQGLELGL